MRRSTRVTTQAAEENTSAHSEKGDEHGQLEVAAGDDLEEEVGVTVVVVEVAGLDPCYQRLLEGANQVDRHTSTARPNAYL